MGQQSEKYVRAEHVGADGATLFTRQQAARYLSTAVSTVRRAEERGALRATVLMGVHCYTLSELEQYRASTRHGEIAARAFHLLEEGRSPAEVVRLLQVPPTMARELAENYAELSEGILCRGPRGSRAAWERAFGVKLTPEIVLRAIELTSRTPKIRERLLSGTA